MGRGGEGGKKIKTKKKNEISKKFKNQDLTPITIKIKMFEQFEKNLIRHSPIDFYQNLRIVDEMHQLAIFLGVFKENQAINREDKIRYARAINFASKTS